MAAIDKIYGTEKQWRELLIWLSQNRPQYIKFMYLQEQIKRKEIMISNFPPYAEKYLLKNCELVWIKAAIGKNYR